MKELTSLVTRVHSDVSENNRHTEIFKLLRTDTNSLRYIALAHFDIAVQVIDVCVKTRDVQWDDVRMRVDLDVE